jgi:hypothetical protein
LTTFLPTPNSEEPLKEWRREMAHKMVFGCRAEAAGEMPGQAPVSSNTYPGLHGPGFVT